MAYLTEQEKAKIDYGIRQMLKEAGIKDVTSSPYPAPSSPSFAEQTIDIIKSILQYFFHAPTEQEKAKLDIGIRNMMKEAGFANVTPSPYISTNQASQPATNTQIVTPSSTSTKPTDEIVQTHKEWQTQNLLDWLKSQKETKPKGKPEPKPTRPTKITNTQIEKESSKITLNNLPQFIMETVISEQAQIKPLQERIMANYDLLKSKIETEKQALTNIAQNYDKIMTELEKTTSEALPKPPTEQEVTTPKNEIIRAVKALTPILVGIAAVIHPGKYGENLTYFNSMVDAIKKNDAEEYEKALRQWEINYQYALQDKELKLKALQLKLNKVTKLGEIELQKLGLDKETIQLEIQSTLETMKAIKDLGKSLTDTYKAIGDILYKQQRLQIEEKKINVLRERANKSTETAFLPKEAKEALKYYTDPLQPESVRKKAEQVLRKYGLLDNETKPINQSNNKDTISQIEDEL